MAGIVGNRYIAPGGDIVVVEIQWGLKSRGESHGGPKNCLVRRISDGHLTVRPFRGLRRI